MKTQTDTADARSQLFQLLALGYAHPVPAFHRVLADDSYSRALTLAASQAQCGSRFAYRERGDFADFEADYIHLFQMGRGGKPIVSLNAADHKEINQEQGWAAESRPEFLLQYTGWYKHFGLRINEDGDANELPDHLVCQLEFMAWLAHLENAKREEPGLHRGYQSAQRDFLKRHLQPFAEVLVASLQHRADQPRVNPFYLSLAANMLEVTDNILECLEHHLTETSHTDAADESDQIATVNLWG